MKFPLRVAQIMGKMVGGGVESTVMNYYRHIDTSKVQFDFLIDADSTLIPKKEIERRGGRIFVIPPYQHQVAYQNKLSQLFRQEKWLIIHSHINTLSVFPLWAAKRAGIPIRIAHNHATAGKGEFVRDVLKYTLRVAANWFPTNRLACSEYAGKWLFGRAPFGIVVNGFEVQKFAFDPQARKRMRHALGIDDKAFVIGHVGRFAPPKNQAKLISYFAHTDLPADSYLVFAGQGPDLEDCRHLADQLNIQNQVIFAGQQRDMPAFYSALDVFALPSTYEGLGMALVEAQASGLPCIASSAVSREADPSQRVGFIPFDDVNAWTNALAQAKPRKDRRLTDQEQYALARFDIKKAAPQLTNYYLRLAKSVNAGSLNIADKESI